MHVNLMFYFVEWSLQLEFFYICRNLRVERYTKVAVIGLYTLRIIPSSVLLKRSWKHCGQMQTW